MAKTKTIFVCQQCAYKTPKWVGKCPSCNSWNSLVEEVESVEIKGVKKTSFNSDNIKKLQDITFNKTERIQIPLREFNRVLGGGLVYGSLVLLGGEPGIGKSTLILQTALSLIDKNILYVSGEESPEQIKMRADRITSTANNCLILSEINVHKIIAGFKHIKPEIVIIDSIQTVFSDEYSSGPGTISQVRACTQIFQEYAKTHNVPFIIIGHINKDGNIAGPMALEHIVDVVLQFEGDANHYYRLLRAKKNRFGSTAELGVFEMAATGLKEIEDPGNMLMPDSTTDCSGVAITPMNEGSRTLMLEVQALATHSVYSSPQRTATGIDLRRLQMLLAVIEKRLGVRLGQKDIFINIAGGIKVKDTAVDLALIAAVISSVYDKIISRQTCFIGEVSLSGQIRPVSNIDSRLREIKRLGFNKVFISESQKTNLKSQKDFTIVKIDMVNELAPKLFS